MSALRMGMASALNRLPLNGQTLASRRRSLRFTPTDDHLCVSLDGADLLHKSCCLHDNTPTDAYKNDRTYTLNPGFTL